MYIIYNSDGSIEKKSITEYIQQGNSYANVLFVTVKDTDLGDYTASAIVTLPNGQNVGAIIEEAEEPVEIDGVEYNGYYITLDETCTLMAGAIRISLSLTIDETRMVTYPIYLNVNATPYDADAPVMISYNQYLELLASIAEVATPNNPTITLQKNGVTVGYFSLNQASNKTINYVLSKSDVGLGNVDNTSDATKKSNFTGSIEYHNTGFVTGGDVYNYALLKNVDQDINSTKRFVNDKELQFYVTGSSNPVAWYSIGNNNGNLRFSLSHYDVGTGTSVLDYSIEWNGESFYPTSANIYDLGSSVNYWKNVYATEYFLKGNTHSLGYEYLMAYIKTYSNSVSRKYYFAPSQFFPDANNTSDLGNSTYKWKDLYLAGTAYASKVDSTEYKVGDYCKIIEENSMLRLESRYGRYLLRNTGNTRAKMLATEDGLSKTLSINVDETWASVKAAITMGWQGFYLYNDSNDTFENKTAELRNGDYDNLIIANNYFDSSNKQITATLSGSDYIVWRIGDNYYANIKSWLREGLEGIHSNDIIVTKNNNGFMRTRLANNHFLAIGDSYVHHVKMKITNLTIEFDITTHSETQISTTNLLDLFNSRAMIPVSIDDNRNSRGIGSGTMLKASGSEIALFGSLAATGGGSSIVVAESALLVGTFTITDTIITQ